MRRSHEPAPPGDAFFFGVATSDHQCEAYDPRCPDIWDLWEERLGLTLRGQATDFWNRYPEDVELARSLGCRAFRFSLSWARIETAPGEFNQEALDHYRDLVQAVREAGMQPIITLLHWTWPLHVEERGGLTAAEFPEWFRRYAREVARHLGEGVRYWITFNEPNAVPFGFIKFWWQRTYPMPPGMGNASSRRQVEATGRVIRNLFLAHTVAREEIRREHPEAKVGANPCVLGLPAWFRRWQDHKLTRARDQEEWEGQEERSTVSSPLAGVNADVVLAPLELNEERDEQALFSEPYLLSRPVLLVPEKGAVKSLLDLSERRVAVVHGTLCEGELRKLLPGARRVRCKDFPSALEAVEGARAEALLAEEAALRGVLEERPGEYRLLPTPLPARAYAAAVAQGDQPLLDLVDTVVRRFKESGEWAESHARHFPGAETLEPPHVARRASLRSGPGPEGWSQGPEFSHEERASPHAGWKSKLETIRRRGRLLVAVNASLPGFSRRDPRTGEWSGLEIDLARGLAQELFGDPSRVEFCPVRARPGTSPLRAVTRAVPTFFRKLRSFSTLLNSNWWHLGMAGKLPPFLCPPECVGKQDFVGLDYYWGISTLRLHRLIRLFEALQQQFSRAPVWPQGFYHVLRYHARLFPGMEILVAENGCPDREDGLTREEYLRRHVAQMLKARRAGMNIVGYLCWSIATCREWGLPCSVGSDFGLFHVDLDGDPTLTRRPTASAEVYRQIVAHATSPQDEAEERPLQQPTVAAPERQKV